MLFRNFFRQRGDRGGGPRTKKIARPMDDGGWTLASKSFHGPTTFSVLDVKRMWVFVLKDGHPHQVKPQLDWARMTCELNGNPIPVSLPWPAPSSSSLCAISDQGDFVLFDPSNGPFRLISPGFSQNRAMYRESWLSPDQPRDALGIFRRGGRLFICSVDSQSRRIAFSDQLGNLIDAFVFEANLKPKSFSWHESLGVGRVLFIEKNGRSWKEETFFVCPDGSSVQRQSAMEGSPEIDPKQDLCDRHHVSVDDQDGTLVNFSWEEQPRGEELPVAWRLESWTRPLRCGDPPTLKSFVLPIPKSSTACTRSPLVFKRLRLVRPDLALISTWRNGKNELVHTHTHAFDLRRGRWIEDFAALNGVLLVVDSSVGNMLLWDAHARRLTMMRAVRTAEEFPLVHRLARNVQEILDRLSPFEKEILLNRLAGENTPKLIGFDSPQ